MTPDDIAHAVERIDAGIAPIRDALNAADRVLGDGDTGMTIAQVVGAWRTALQTPAADVGAMLVALGKETRRASGSSLGSVIAIGLGAAGRHATGMATVPREGVPALIDAATRAIAERSGATAGDKTMLDALLRIRDDIAASDAGSPVLDVAARAARAALDTFREREVRTGRARMYGARSVGHDDPGMLAMALLLEAIRR